METLTDVHYTPREFDVIKHLLLRVTRKKIAGKLALSNGTVDNHIKHLFLKTDSHSIEGLVIYLLSHDFSVNREMTEVRFLLEG
jgi:DNA-binding CsgD family transcriptional regulator